jgi:hypothetical protein
MSIVKNSSAPYIIHTLNASDPIVLDSANVIIRGNLEIFGVGTSTTINTVETLVYDQIFTLNAGYNIEPPSSALTSGIEVFRGNTRPSMQMLWFEGASPPGFRISTETSTFFAGNGNTVFDRVFRHISTYDPTTGFNMANLSDDLTPTLGGPLDVEDKVIFTTNAGIGTANVRIDSNLSLQKYNPVVTTVTNGYVTLTGGNVRQGGSGVYVTTDEQNTQGQELVTKKRALALSLLFI